MEEKSGTVPDPNDAGVPRRLRRRPGADETPAEEPVTLRVAALKGPTAMGMVKLMDDSKPVTEAVEEEHEDVGTSRKSLRLYAGGLGG